METDLWIPDADSFFYISDSNGIRGVKLFLCKAHPVILNDDIDCSCVFCNADIQTAGHLAGLYSMYDRIFHKGLHEQLWQAKPPQSFRTADIIGEAVAKTEQAQGTVIVQKIQLFPNRCTVVFVQYIPQQPGKGVK